MPDLLGCSGHRGSKALLRENVRLAKAQWPSEVESRALSALRKLSNDLDLSVALGDILLLDGKWYVTGAGLLRLAKANRCRGIRTSPIVNLCDPATGRWVFKATVYKSLKSKGFVGYGDADPSNVSPVVRGAEMRVAETRAVNRALRKAYGIGLCSVEEVGSYSSPSEPNQVEETRPTAAATVSGNGQPRLRDRLCQLIRQHELDPSLVKRYAADFCGTETLRGASRDLVETFVNNLADWAAKDRAGLICHLNGYVQKKEVKR